MIIKIISEITVTFFINKILIQFIVLGWNVDLWFLLPALGKFYVIWNLLVSYIQHEIETFHLLWIYVIYIYWSCVSMTRYPDVQLPNISMKQILKFPIQYWWKFIPFLISYIYFSKRGMQPNTKLIILYWKCSCCISFTVVLSKSTISSSQTSCFLEVFVYPHSDAPV